MRAVMVHALEQPEPLAAEPSECDWLNEAALAQLREIIVPRSRDRFIVLRSKGLARLLKCLRSADQLAPLVDEQEPADLTGLLGARPASGQAGRERLAAAVREPGAPRRRRAARLRPAGGLGDPGAVPVDGRARRPAPRPAVTGLLGPAGVEPGEPTSSRVLARLNARRRGSTLARGYSAPGGR